MVRNYGAPNDNIDDNIYRVPNHYTGIFLYIVFVDYYKVLQRVGFLIVSN